jgi:hypothetical protein
MGKKTGFIAVFIFAILACRISNPAPTAVLPTTTQVEAVSTPQEFPTA